MDVRALPKPLKDGDRADPESSGCDSRRAPGAEPDALRDLAEKTERYCVVMQTLVTPPRLVTDWA